MKFSYCSFILLLFTQVSIAHSGKSHDFCLEIKRDKDQPDLCTKMGTRYPNYSQIIAENCTYVRNAFINSFDQADTTCAKTFGALSTVAQSTTISFVAPAPVGLISGAHLEEAPARASEEMNKCQPKPISAYTCQANFSIKIPNLDDILYITKRLPLSVNSNQYPKYTDDACACFNKQSQGIIREKGVVVIELNINKEKEKINDLIFKAAGTRILNSFAGNLEDINFYRANLPALIGGDESALKLECNDASQYRQKVLRACTRNEVDPKVMEERMSSILSSLGDSKEDKTLEAKLATIQNKVLGLDLTKKINGETGLFTRTRYDQIRFGAAKGLPEVNFLNDVTDALMDHEILGPELEHEMKVENYTPGRAIFSMLRKENRPEVKDLLMKLAKDPKNSGDFSREMIAVLETPIDTDLATLIEQKVVKTMEMHPSLKALFKDTELFYKVREASHRGGTHSLLTQMENNPSYLKEYYEDRCGKIQDQFAEAVCVPDNNFVDLTNREDLNNLLTPFEKDINPNLKDLIICRIPRTQIQDSVFQKLAFRTWDRITESDYWRSTKPGKTDGTFLADVRAIVNSGDQKAFAYLGGLSKMGDVYRAPDKEYVEAKLKNDTFLGTGAGPGAKDENTAASSSSAVTENTREYAAIKVLGQISDNFAGSDSQNIPYVPGSTDYNSPAPLPPLETKGRKDRSTRSALRDFLADSENSEEIDRHLARTKSEDHEELLKIREELAKNKEMLLNLSTQTEQNKLKALQEKYQALENDIQRNNVTQTKTQEVNESRSESRSAFVSGNSSVASNTPGDVSANNNIAPGAQNSVSESGTGMAARNPASISNARLNTDATGSERNFAFSSSSPQGEIMIEQSNNALISGQQMAPEDLGMVIKKYVEQTELDVQTLRQLKDQEVVIKYKVVENGVEVLKTMTVKSDTLTPETKKFLADQIAIKEKEVERNEARRAHSFATLKLLLGIKAKSIY